MEQPAEPDSGSSGEIEQQPAEDTLSDSALSDSTDAAPVQSEVRHRISESTPDRLERYFDDWAVIGLLGIAVIGVLLLSINLVRGDKK